MSDREQRFQKASRCFPWLGEGSVTEYVSIRRSRTPETIPGRELTPEEEFCLWVFGDARNLWAQVASAPPEEPLPVIYGRFFYHTIIDDPSNDTLLEDDSNSPPVPNQKRLKIFANRVFFRDEEKKSFPLHLAGSLGLVAVGLAYKDTAMRLSQFREIVEKYLEGNEVEEIQGIFSELGEPLNSQFLLAEKIFRKSERSIDLDRDEKMFKLRVDHRYGSIKSYMRNLLIAAYYIENAHRKLQHPIDR